MWNSNIKRLVVFVIIFSFLSFPLYSTKSFDTKQSETHEDCKYLCRGSEKPSSLLKEIDQTNKRLECANFLYYEDSIIFQASLGTKIQTRWK
ncbi:MAG: hypothetical protein KAH01_04440 [Caldisericia bacterium]|nr:hypothetical protein [Caldisericia bacterium]